MRLSAIVSVALLATACGDSSEDASDQLIVPETAAGSGQESASDALPSTVVASTVVPPSLPPACVVAMTMFVPLDTGNVQVMNHATGLCELDLAGSPSLSPESEPTVWIESGKSAELDVESSDSCSSPVSTLTVMVDAAAVDVPLNQPVCDPTIVAVYTVD